MFGLAWSYQIDTPDMGESHGPLADEGRFYFKGAYFSSKKSMRICIRDGGGSGPGSDNDPVVKQSFCFAVVVENWNVIITRIYEGSIEESFN